MMYTKDVETTHLLLVSSVGPIESTMYLSSSFVMRLSSTGDSVIHVNQTTHQIIATQPINIRNNRMLLCYNRRGTGGQCEGKDSHIFG